MSPQTKNYGFIPDVIAPEDYVFLGATKAPVIELEPTGQLDKWLPVYEAQNINGVETFACVSFGTTTAIEILLRRLENQEQNYSERYLSILAETTKQGNSPKKVADTVKAKGLIAQHYLPFDETIKRWEDFHSPKPMPDRYLEIGGKFLGAYKFYYEWLYGSGESQNPEKMKHALKGGPLGAAVAAWPIPRDGIYYKEGQTNHWITIYGYEDGKYWKIFDSYGGGFKKLDWNYDFDYVEKFTIEVLPKPLPKDSTDPVVIVSPEVGWRSFITAVMEFIRNMLTRFIR